MPDVLIVTHGDTALITEPSLELRRWLYERGFVSLACSDHGARMETRFALEMAAVMLDAGYSVETTAAH